MNIIEERIRGRKYQSPSRARATVSRSALRGKDKQRLHSLCDEWAMELELGARSGHPIVGALPAGRSDVDTDDAEGAVETDGFPVGGDEHTSTRLRALTPGDGAPFVQKVSVNLNAKVLVHLNVVGVAWLHEARSRVVVREDIIERGGVWETTLGEFMMAFGSKLSAGGESPCKDFSIELLVSR